MNKSKIEWCDQTWNPVTGCFHGCPYCYAKKYTKRFGGHLSEPGKQIHDLKTPMYKEIEHYDNGCSSLTVSITPPEIELRRMSYPFDFEPTFHRYRLDEPQETKKPQNIFVCSMADLFGAWVPDEWIQQVFKACEKAPQHRYLFLTKNPKRYQQINSEDEDIPKLEIYGESLFFGTSVTNNEQFNNAYESAADWISIEPLLEELYTENFVDFLPPDGSEARRWLWVVIGAETGNRKGKVIPKRDWIEAIVETCRFYRTPVFMKNSLAEIWGAPLIQEYPWEKG